MTSASFQKEILQTAIRFSTLARTVVVPTAVWTSTSAKVGGLLLAMPIPFNSLSMAPGIILPGCRTTVPARFTWMGSPILLKFRIRKKVIGS